MKPFATAAALIVLLSSSLGAQEQPTGSQATKEHEFLKKFVGDWESVGKTVAAPGQESMTCGGKIHNKMVGGFWVVSEMKSEMSGMKFTAIQTIGYDEKSKKYVGTWIDSMMNHMWKYEGSVDKTGKILTLDTEGPDFFKPGATAKYRDIYEFKSDDHILTTSEMQGKDGKWITFMTGDTKRKK
ncbi:MAG: DUF1579 domain-containing protein [Planctomycetaceae bacterium]|nr:DUF1579 domain-containing protein [Planctomycetaceae bacterium]